jgi:hypothetical protein
LVFGGEQNSNISRNLANLLGRGPIPLFREPGTRGRDANGPYNDIVFDSDGSGNATELVRKSRFIPGKSPLLDQGAFFAQFLDRRQGIPGVSAKLTGTQQRS